MSEEKEQPEKLERIVGGYMPEKRGYQPTQVGHEFGYQSTHGNLDVSNPPQGGSGVPQNPPQGGLQVPQSTSSSSEKPEKKE